jgi:hypothetical protein
MKLDWHADASNIDCATAYCLRARYSGSGNWCGTEGVPFTFGNALLTMLIETNDRLMYEDAPVQTDPLAQMLDRLELGRLLRCPN